MMLLMFGCDTVPDSGEPPRSFAFYADADGDGYGDPSTEVDAPVAPAGTVPNDLDCDDAAAAVHPGALEVCDGVDQDCDAVVDDDAIDARPAWQDADGDGFGDPSVELVGCAGVPPGVADCDDADAGANPGAVEICSDGVDEDCDGEDPPCAAVLLTDADGLLVEDADATVGVASALVAGDFTGDGQPDLLLAVSPAARQDEGLWGWVGPTLSPDLADDDFRWAVGDSSEIGARVLVAGDFDGDGSDDLVASGERELWCGETKTATGIAFGPVAPEGGGTFSTGVVTDMTVAVAVHTGGADGLLWSDGQPKLLLGLPTSGVVGGDEPVALGDDDEFDGVAALDVDGDGLDELVVGQSWAWGVLYVLPQTAASVKDFDLQLKGDFADVGLGAPRNAGDTDGDGHPELLATSASWSDEHDESGAAFVFDLAALGTGTLPTDVARTTFEGEHDGDHVSTALGDADVNGDGAADVLVVSEDCDGDAGGELVGRDWLLFGPLPVGEVSLAGADATITGTTDGESLGELGSFLGDQDGDGRDDLALGTRRGREDGAIGAFWLFPGATW